MSDEELLIFADQTLSLPIPKGTPRTKILSRIVSSAIAARDSS